MTMMSAPAIPRPGYHAELANHLRTTEPELWEWFAEAVHQSPDEVATIELDLLKTAYRMEDGVGHTLNSDAALIAGQLGLDAEVTCYQALDSDDQPNATVHILFPQAPAGDAEVSRGVHVVFAGPLMELLDPGEQRAVLAHELAHVSLLLTDGGNYRILDGLVHRLALHGTAHDAIGETARRLRLHTEVYADAVAAALTDRNDLIAALVKTHTGSRNVDPGAYLRQAEQILLSDDSATAAWTHPELHIRTACISAHSSPTPNHSLIERIIDGPDDLDHLDLLGMVRVRRMTVTVLELAATHLASSGASAGSYLDAFGHDLGIGDAHPGAAAATAEDPSAHFENAQPSLRHYAAALLTDLAMLHGRAAPADSPEVAALSGLAEELGVSTEFDKLIAKETSLTLGAVRKLRRQSRDAP